MKHNPLLLAGGLFAGCLPLQTWAGESPAPITAQAIFGPEIERVPITEVIIKNYDDVTLGRIAELALDLQNVRVVEVLVVSNQVLRTGGKIVALPPQCLMADPDNKIYRVDMSEADFKKALEFDPAKWAESTQAGKLSATYRYFRRDPYFVVPGEDGPQDVAGEPIANLVALGPVEPMGKIIGMEVENLKGTRLGKLQTLVLDVPTGRISNTYIQSAVITDADSLRQSSTIITPKALSFNAGRDRLVLDLSKVEYSEMPQVIFRIGADGQVASSSEQSAARRPVNALPQGNGYDDIDMTAQIYRSIHLAKLDTSGTVEVGTLNGRVTLRGPVNTQAIKDSIGAIAVAAVKLDNVNNQIVVKRQL